MAVATNIFPHEGNMRGRKAFSLISAIAVRRRFFCEVDGVQVTMIQRNQRKKEICPTEDSNCKPLGSMPQRHKEH